MTRHSLTYAETILVGKASYEKYHKGDDNLQGARGAEAHLPYYVSLGTPAVADADGIATAQAVAGAGNLTLDGAVASGGVATLTPARNVTILSAGDDSGITFTVTGTDFFGETLVETITGANAGTASGAKAFATVTQIAASGAAAGNVSAGFGDVLGLPRRISSKNMVSVKFDGAADAATVVAGVDTTATATTGDTRGTIDIAGTLNGSKEVSVIFHYIDRSTKALCFGVDQYGG